MILLALFILFLHWFADFVCQSDRVAVNKSKSLLALSEHVFIYAAIFLIFLSCYFPLGHVIFFVLINASLHFATDYGTSRCTSKLWEKGDRHNFFVVIGADQFIHQACLLSTIWIL